MHAVKSINVHFTASATIQQATLILFDQINPAKTNKRIELVNMPEPPADLTFDKNLYPGFKICQTYLHVGFKIFKRANTF